MNITNTLPQRIGSKYTPALMKALALPPGQYVQLDFGTLADANSCKSSLSQTIKRNEYLIGVFMRGKSVYIGRAK